MQPLFTQSLRTLAGAVIFACAIGTAQASTIAYETTGFISSASPGFFHPSFNIATGGTYLATLTDLSFNPLGFSALMMSVSTSTINLGSTSTPGSFSFTAGPGNYFANVVGAPTGLGGIFGVQISQVPLPPSLKVFLGGIAMLGFSAYRRLPQSHKG